MKHAKPKTWADRVLAIGIYVALAVILVCAMVMIYKWAQ